jgi:hypothetical protein
MSARDYNGISRNKPYSRGIQCIGISDSPQQWRFCARHPTAKSMKRIKTSRGDYRSPTAGV